MKSNALIAVSLSLMLVACSPSTQPLVRQSHPGSQPGAQAQTPAHPGADRLSDALQVRIAFPKSASKGARFHTLDALASEAAYVRLVIKAADLSREYTNSGGITLNGVDHLEAISPAEAESGKLLSVTGVPRGSNRLVIAQVYDAQGRELTSLRAMGLYHSRDDVPEGSTRFADENITTSEIEQTVSRRYLPLLSMLEAAIDNDDQDFLDAIETHLDTLASEFDQLVYGSNPVGGGTFAVDPQSLDFAEIYTLLSAEVANESFEPETELDAFFTANQASFTESPVDVTVWLATPTGFDFTQDMKVLIDDPNSSETSVTSTNADSPLSVTVNDVLRGSRRLTVTSADGLILGHTTVTVDPDVSPGYIFAGGAGSTSGNPLVLVGGETGIVISSIVSPGNNLAEVQGTAMTLNGVGYAENPNQSANLVKFTHNNNGEGAVTVPPTSASTTSVNLNVPDLIGGTYLITVERLGVISNSRNFSIVPVAAQLEQPAASVVTTAANGSTLTVRGTGFDPDPSDITVYFGATAVTPTAVAGDRHSLTVQVPASTFGTQDVKVMVGGQTSATTAFKIKPVISVLKNLAETSTTTARIGDEILIDGTGFSTVDGGNTVSFGSVTVPQSDITELSENRLRVKVPAEVWGTANVTVAVEGVSSSSSGFEVTPAFAPTGAFAPTDGIVGSTVTITGSGFAPTAAGNTVKFGNSTVPTSDITVNSNTSLTVKVPDGIFANPPVTVKVGNLTSASSNGFHVIPTLDAAGPSSGRVTDTITLTGSGFNPTAGGNLIKFTNSGVTIAPSSASNTSLTFNLPSGVWGTEPMRIEIDSRESAPRNFGVIPVVSSLTSQKGPAGHVFSVTGSGFSPTAANNTVRFVSAGNNPTASIGTASAGSLQVTAPASMAFNQNITVTVAGRTSTETRYFVGIPNVTTFAGSIGNAGSADSPGERFDHPFALALDSNGIFHISDGANDAIRKMTAGGTVTTFSTTAILAAPRGVAFDGNDNLYVTNFGNNAVYRITPAGNASLQDGAYNSPRAVAVNKSTGVVYVADTDNHRIMKIVGGVASNLAGQLGSAGHNDASGTSARFNEPFGIAVDPSTGDIYVADRGNHVIRRITPGGAVTTIAGSVGNSGSSDGVGTAARFFQPEGIDIDADGNLYISDTDNCQIRLIDPNRRVTTLAGSGNRATLNGTGLAAEFNEPDHLVFRAPDDLFVAEFDAHVIRRLTP